MEFAEDLRPVNGNTLFTAQDCKAGHLFDKWAYMGPKRRRLLDDSWSGLFRKGILVDRDDEQVH